MESFKDLGLSKNSGEDIYNYVKVFKNPNNLPINRIQLERSWYELRRDLPKDLGLGLLPDEDFQKTFYEKKTEMIPALDKRWLPKCTLHTYFPYDFTLPKEENVPFVTNNMQFLETLDYLLKCNYHQFWCTILFEPSAGLALRSFIGSTAPWFQSEYLEDEYADIFKTVCNKFLLVYEKLLTFNSSQSEYMPEEYGLQQLVNKKLIYLPTVLTLAHLYKDSNLDFVNKLTNLYFNDTSRLAFQLCEGENIINYTLMVLETIEGLLCGFDKDTVAVPISISKKPPTFNLSWVYSTVNYLLISLSLLNTLLQYWKPSIEICLRKKLPHRLPVAYVRIYRELYKMLGDRAELVLQRELSERVFEEMNLGRTEFIDIYHVFVSHCLDKTLENMGDTKQQEQVVETYLNLLTTALEYDHFICDYNMKYEVAIQNEMFESCFPLDTTRTKLIESCISKFPRQEKLQPFSKLKKQTTEDMCTQFKPTEVDREVLEPQPCSSKDFTDTEANRIESMIKDIINMFPHIGEGFALQCLEFYNYNSADVIHAILEENLPPHLYDIPFDLISIEELASDPSYFPDDEYDDGKQSDRSNMNLYEDQDLIEEWKIVKYRSRNSKRQISQKKLDVVNKTKGQGQEKNVLEVRDNKNVRKSRRRNRKRPDDA